MRKKTKNFITIILSILILFIFNANNNLTAYAKNNNSDILNIQKDILSIFQNIENYTIEEIPEMNMYATNNVNIRSGPETNYPIVGTLQKNQEITCIGIVDDKWYQIKYENNEYFISKKYLSPKKIEEIIISQEETPKTDIPTNNTYGIFETIGNISSEAVSKANKQLSMIPQSALDSFVNNGCHIYLTDENIAQTMFDGQYSSVQGGTLYLEKIIKIENRDKAIKNSIIHEFGHYVYWTSGYFYNEKYQQLLNAFNTDVGNASLMNISYGLNSPEEFYAEVFWKYITNTDKTENSFPNITKMIKDDLNSL